MEKKEKNSDNRDGCHEVNEIWDLDSLNQQTRKDYLDAHINGNLYLQQNNLDDNNDECHDGCDRWESVKRRCLLNTEMLFYKSRFL